MSRLKREIGLDWFDLGVHVGITVLVMGMLGASNAPDALVLGAAALSLGLLAIRRRWARRHAGAAGLSTGEMASARIEELEQRLTELDLAHQRISELEERVDFAERLMAASRESEERRVVPPYPGSLR